MKRSDEHGEYSCCVQGNEALGEAIHRELDRIEAEVYEMCPPTKNQTVEKFSVRKEDYSVAVAQRFHVFVEQIAKRDNISIEEATIRVYEECEEE